jgi:hypothetical protein
MEDGSVRELHTCDMMEERNKCRNSSVNFDAEVIGTNFTSKLSCSPLSVKRRVDSSHVHRDKHPVSNGLRTGDVFYGVKLCYSAPRGRSQDWLSALSSQNSEYLYSFKLLMSPMRPAACCRSVARHKTYHDIMVRSDFKLLVLKI